MSSLIKKIYNLTCEGRQFVSIEPPKAVPDSYYSLVEVSYNSYLISSIKGIYVGKDKTEQTECIFREVILDDQIKGIGDTYLIKINNHIKEMESDEIETIISNIDIIDFAKEDPVDVLQKIFMIGIGSMIAYFYFISDDQEDLGYPFYPINIEYPLDVVDITVIDGNVFDYFSYSARILLNINSDVHGKLWMAQMADFWNGWSSLFPRNIILQQHDIEKAAYEAVVGYSEFLYLETSSIYKYYKTAENVVKDGCGYIQDVTNKGLNLMKIADTDLQKRYRYATVLISTVGTMVLKTIKSETDLSIDEIKLCKDNCVNILKDATASVLSARNIMIEELEQYQEVVMEDLHKLSLESIQSVGGKMDKIQNEMVGLERKLKIYATRNVEDIQQTKVDIIQDIYEEIPTIKQDIRKDITRDITKIKSQMETELENRIERHIKDNLDDVLNETVETLAETLTETLTETVEKRVKKRLKKELEPIVQDHIDKFKTGISGNGQTGQRDIDKFKTGISGNNQGGEGNTDDLILKMKSHLKEVKDIKAEINADIKKGNDAKDEEIRILKTEVKELQNTVGYLSSIISQIGEKLGVIN